MFKTKLWIVHNDWCIMIMVWVMWNVQFLTSFLLCESCQHLIEYVVVFFIWKRPHHPRLIQEVTMDLGPVECSICYLHLDEMTLKEKVCWWILSEYLSGFKKELTFPYPDHYIIACVCMSIILLDLWMISSTRYLPSFFYLCITYNTTRFRVGCGLCRAEGAEHSEGGCQMLEGVCLWPTTRHVK